MTLSITLSDSDGDGALEVRVTVKQSNGDLFGAGARVALFLVDQDFPVATGTTDGTSAVSFPRDSSDTREHWAAAWDEAGEAQAVTVRSLVPEAP